MLLILPVSFSMFSCKLLSSHGLNIVTVAQHTRIKEREKYFSEIPKDFYRNNLNTKYEKPQDLFGKSNDQVYRRLLSWGINTIGANFFRAHKGIGSSPNYR